MKILPLAAALLWMIPTGSQAAMLLSNTGNSYDLAVPVDANTENDVFVGQSFVTGPNSGSPWLIGNVSLRIGDATTPVNGPFSVSIYNNNANHPGTLVGALSGNAAPSTDGVYVYSSANGLSLSAGTQYWIVATAPSTTSGAYNWASTADTSFSTQATGWSTNTAASVAVSANGSAWTVYAQNEEGTLMFSIETAVVPEPSTVFLLVTGLAGLMVVRARHQAAGAPRQV